MRQDGEGPASPAAPPQPQTTHLSPAGHTPTGGPGHAPSATLWTGGGGDACFCGPVLLLFLLPEVAPNSLPYPQACLGFIGGWVTSLPVSVSAPYLPS